MFFFFSEALLLLLSCFDACCIFKEIEDGLVLGDVYVAHDAATDEAAVDGDELGVFQLILDGDVCEFDVEKLIDRVKRSGDFDVVLELDRDPLVGEAPEERVEQLHARIHVPKASVWGVWSAVTFFAHHLDVLTAKEKEEKEKSWKLRSLMEVEWRS